METRILPVDASKIGAVTAGHAADDLLDTLSIDYDDSSADVQNLRYAAQQLRTSDIPVAFPTETVYGLGADATRSAAVKGIYKAKQRPSDNPLIVHFASLKQLRSLLSSGSTQQQNGGLSDQLSHDPIPDIYRPLISQFWPGPLTIILPNPPNSPLAPEVTAGLSTFGARMPRHTLASALIQLADVPIAAPSANASTKPSPTAAEHVLYDLHGRIETIVDGGPCDVGVESTVVDGLCEPPLVLRPGGISLEQIRGCRGWETTQIGYKNASELGDRPKAPGMKYRHYSPRATVILYEARTGTPSVTELFHHGQARSRVGLIRTKTWKLDRARKEITSRSHQAPAEGSRMSNGVHRNVPGFAGMLQELHRASRAKSTLETHDLEYDARRVQLLDIELGPEVSEIARGMFSALRDLDREDVDAIIVEGIDDNEGDTAAAVMNRLRKAAEMKVVP